MTMPALIANYNNHITEVRLKKFYSIFNQAIQQSVAENGDTSTWDYWFNGEYDNEKNETPEDYSGVLNEKFDRYIAPYMKIVDKKVVNSPKLYKMQLYYLADGSAFGYPLIHNREIYFYPKNAIRCMVLYVILHLNFIQIIVTQIGNIFIEKDWSRFYINGMAMLKN